MKRIEKTIWHTKKRRIRWKFELNFGQFTRRIYLAWLHATRKNRVGFWLGGCWFAFWMIWD